MGNATFVTPEMLSELVLAKIPEELIQVVLDLSATDKSDVNVLTLAVKEKLQSRLTTVMSEMGIEVSNLIVGNINLREGE